MTHLVTAPTHKQSDKHRGLSTMLITAVLLGSPLLLSSCGFHLRGYDAPMAYSVGSTVLSINEDDIVSFRIKRPLKQRLNAVGINVVDDIGRQINSSNQLYTSTIKVSNVQLKRYELVGVLTEVRLVLSADVIYETLNNSDGASSAPMIVKNKVQVERTYQFDEASVSIEDKQGAQIQDWLYDNLSQRIADQYVALSLPRVAPEASTKQNPKPLVVAPKSDASTNAELVP
uniref:LPS-assembly lipoprotein LptE n=1 Tax=Psychrobacter sp. (strain PRwf-1) TaxID=349106 RepID=A5WGI0_PSYWF